MLPTSGFTIVLKPSRDYLRCVFGIYVLALLIVWHSEYPWLGFLAITVWLLRAIRNAFYRSYHYSIVYQKGRWSGTCFSISSLDTTPFLQWGKIFGKIKLGRAWVQPNAQQALDYSGIHLRSFAHFFVLIDFIDDTLSRKTWFVFKDQMTLEEYGMLVQVYWHGVVI